MSRKSFNRSNRFLGDNVESGFDNLFETNNIVNEKRGQQRKNRFW